MPLVRPIGIAPLVPEQSVLDSSNGRLHWQFLAEPVHAGIDVVRPRAGPFDGIVMSVTAYLGPEGTFAEQAARVLSPEAQLRSAVSVHAAISALRARQVR